MNICDKCGRAVDLRGGLRFVHCDDLSPGCETDGIVYVSSMLGPDETGKCDFCSALSPEMKVTVSAIETSVLAFEPSNDQTSTITVRNSDEWAVCSLCQLDASRGNFDLIVDRAVTALTQGRNLPPQIIDDVHAQITELHSTVWETWDGKFLPL